MSAAYRAAALPCPACVALLEPTTVGEAVIDVCPACAGIWVDWFDGDLAEMARASDAAPTRAIAPRGAPTCPRCQLGLDEELHAGLRSEDGERVTGGGAVILRCAECAGAFVPGASVRLLASAPPSADDLPQSFWGKLLAVLRGFLGR